MAKLKIPVTSSDHVAGPEQAAVTLVEYGDYQCPGCGEAYPIVKELQRNRGQSLCFVFRNFPLTEVHSHAEAAAETAEFAGAHGKFWGMHDALFENQDMLGAELYSALAESLGLPVGELGAAFRAGTYRPRVRNDLAGGVRSGVSGTPTFFINGVRHDASLDFDTLSAALDAAASAADR